MLRRLTTVLVVLTIASPIALARPARGASTRTAVTPGWMTLVAGSSARVDIAPWLVSDEPEAALTESAASIARDFTAHAERPGDVLFEPIGVRVRIVRVLAGGRVAYVRGRDATFRGYALVSRLVPEIPPGTMLRAAGGFQGFSDFFPTIATPYREALRLETGSALLALAMGAGPYDPDTADLVRVRVRVLSGGLRGRTGWVAVAYTGLPWVHPPPTAAVAERACGCRIVEFGLATESPI